MVATLNFDLKDAPPELWEGSHWAVLTMLVLHANVRNRCWPSIDFLVDKLGKSTSTVIAAIKWLRRHGAVTLVPKAERVDREKTLPARQYVYQLTGKLTFGERTICYLYMPSEGAMPASKQGAPKVSKAETSTPTKVSETEVSPAESFSQQNLSIPTKDSTKSTVEVKEIAREIVVKPLQTQVDPELKLMLYAVWRVTGLDYRMVDGVMEEAQKYCVNGYIAENAGTAYQCWLSDNAWKWKNAPANAPLQRPKLDVLTEYLGRAPFEDRATKYSFGMELGAVCARVRATGDFAALEPGYMLPELLEDIPTLVELEETT